MSKAAEASAWACPHCNATFSSQRALKIHAAKAHRILEHNLVRFDRRHHAVDGMRVCRFCGKKYTRWTGLSDHIGNKRCKAIGDTSHDHPDGEQNTTIQEHTTNSIPATEADAKGAEPIAYPERSASTRRGNMHAMLQDDSTLHELLHHRALCNQRVVSANSNMKTHYRRTHKGFLQQHEAAINNLLQRKATPCSTCHSCKNKHKAWRVHIATCSVAWQ